MFVGHGLVAFAVVASLARSCDWPADRALAVGVVAALFGTLPDIDMVYALVGLAGGLEGIGAVADSFWGAALVVHRSMTHSLVVGAVAAVAFTAWTGRRGSLASPDPATLLAAGLSVGLVGVAGLADGPLAAAILAIFLLGGLGIVRLARAWEFGPKTVGLAASVGLLTHPFGDLLTGAPPALAYPFELGLLTGRVSLHADPTMHLLGAFFVELATIWVALAVFARLRGWRLRSHISPRASLGVSYASAVVLVPAPTLEVASPFVFSVLAVGLLGVGLDREAITASPRETVSTALAAVTVAALAYAGAYLFL